MSVYLPDYLMEPPESEKDVWCERRAEALTEDWEREHPEYDEAPDSVIDEMWELAKREWDELKHPDDIYGVTYG